MGTQPTSLGTTARKSKKPQAIESLGACYLAERVGFEPTVPCGTPDFESVALYLHGLLHEGESSSAKALAVPFSTLLGRFPRTTWRTW